MYRRGRSNLSGIDPSFPKTDRWRAELSFKQKIRPANWFKSGRQNELNSYRFRLRYLYLYSLIIIVLGIMIEVPPKKPEYSYMEYITVVSWGISIISIRYFLVFLISDVISRILTSGISYYYVFISILFFVSVVFDVESYNNFSSNYARNTQIITDHNVTPEGWWLFIRDAGALVIRIGLPVALLEAYRRGGNRHDTT